MPIRSKLPLATGLFATAALAASLFIARTFVADKDTNDLLACMEVQRGPIAWVCREGFYRLHPTTEEIEQINRSASLWQFAEYSDEAEARRMVSHLIAAGADINRANQAPSLFKRKDGRPEAPGWTALHMAALNANDRAIRILLEAGAKVDVRDNAGKTALELALERQRAVPSTDHSKVIALLSAKTPP